MKEVAFPTLGEFIKGLYELSGVLPNIKKPEENTEKEALRKTLTRLAKEEGPVLDHYRKCVEQLSLKLKDIAPSLDILSALLEVLYELEQTYCNVLRTEASFLGKEKTRKWVLDRYLPGKLALSLNKQVCRFNLHHLETVDVEFWYLPTEDNCNAALSNYFEWLYRVLGVSQSEFHFPSRDEWDAVEKLNFDNVSKWKKVNSDRLPSWALLKHNLERAFDSLEQPIQADRVKHFLFLAFLARLSSVTCKLIKDVFGSKYLAELVDKYQRHVRTLHPHFPALMQIAADNGPISPYQEYHSKAIGQRIDDYFEHLFIQCSDSSYVQLLWRETQQYPAEMDDSALLQACVQLLEDKHPSIAAIEELEDRIGKNAEYMCLLWITQWTRAKLAYRAGERIQAFELYQKAFAIAKYSAGNQIEPILNQFLHVSAKLEKWKEFKAIYGWASFLGIRVRYRDLTQAPRALMKLHQSMEVVI